MINDNRNKKIENLIRVYNNHKSYRSTYTRKQHHYNTLRFSEIENIVKLNLHSTVKEVCYNHGVDREKMKITNTWIKGEKIDSEKLSVFLRMVDGLDSSKNRVSKNTYKLLSDYVSNDDIDPYSLTHWAKHLIVDRIDFETISDLSNFNDLPPEFISGSKNTKKLLNIKLLLNEKISRTMMSRKPIESRVRFTEEDSTGYVRIADNYDYLSSLFGKFLHQYFYWTVKGISDFNEMFSKVYGVELVFTYRLGKKKPKHSTLVYNYLQE